MGLTLIARTSDVDTFALVFDSWCACFFVRPISESDVVESRETRYGVGRRSGAPRFELPASADWDGVEKLYILSGSTEMSVEEIPV